MLKPSYQIIYYLIPNHTILKIIIKHSPFLFVSWQCTSHLISMYEVDPVLSLLILPQFEGDMAAVWGPMRVKTVQCSHHRYQSNIVARIQKHLSFSTINIKKAKSLLSTKFIVKRGHKDWDLHYRLHISV